MQVEPKDLWWKLPPQYMTLPEYDNQLPWLASQAKLSYSVKT